MTGWKDEATATWACEEQRRETVGVVQVLDGPDNGRTWELGIDRATLGKSVSATLRLTDPTVSRLHLELSAGASDQVHVRDLGSKNGTWLGTTRILAAEVAPGTRLRVGSTTIGLAVREVEVRRPKWLGDDRLGPLIGRSRAMHQLFARLVLVGGGDSRVLLRGESGTGKELAARCLHQLSLRANQPFVVVDAAAMAGSLVEDELFGHVRGAFTGAESDRLGAFARANGGTLFLDEIGDLPLSLQAKLLRVIEEGSLLPLGGSDREQVDVRVIAATHKPLERMVNDRSFREDLYYRLSVIELTMPSLRARPADVPLLARHFLDDWGELEPAAWTEVEAALHAHRGHSWPGNARELRNFVRRVAVLGRSAAGTVLTPEEGPPTLRADLPYHEARADWLALFERSYVERILDETGGNIAEAARRSGVSRVHLSNLVGRLGLRKDR